MSNAFKAAAGIPVFIAYGGYLLAAEAITRLAGSIGEYLFDRQPAFQHLNQSTSTGPEKSLVNLIRPHRPG